MNSEKISLFVVRFVDIPNSYIKHVHFQVVSNGRVQYTVNGSNATQQRVQDMFRSVGMNVNNPHFLIMQGKIGKVLNMNAKEVSDDRFRHFVISCGISRS